MSTTFGVRSSNNEIIPVAHRIGVGNGRVRTYYINDIAHLLDDNVEAVAMDNTQQGIHTMGDIRRAAEEYNDTQI